MSRCFPYPPPGYTLSSARNEALTESIKLQKEKQKEKDKKDKRKERKEKRKERKERRKEKKDKKILNSDKSDIVEDHIDQKTHLDFKEEPFFQKTRETQTEQFEPSSLTEEHGHPNGLPVPSSSYESTENCNKRKRHSSSTGSSEGHGKSILIRLPSRTRSDFHALADRPPENSNIKRGFSVRNNGEEICSSSGQDVDVFTPGKPGARSIPQGAELQYRDLVEKWFPPRLEDASLYPDDSGWLFREQSRHEWGEKRQRLAGDSMPCSRSSALWARAEYLRDIDTYALPFVVPY